MTNAVNRPCLNCGAMVSLRYVRVFAREESDGVECCPQCHDRVRLGSEVREVRSSRDHARAVDPDDEPEPITW